LEGGYFNSNNTNFNLINALFESFRAQRSGVETRNEVESPEGKSVF